MVLVLGYGHWSWDFALRISERSWVMLIRELDSDSLNVRFRLE